MFEMNIDVETEEDLHGKLKEKKFNADYVILAIGSNDCDDVDRVCKARAYRCEKETQYKKETLAEIRKWYKDLKYHQTQIVKKIRSVCKGKRIYFLPILPRRWWGHHARKMALLLNHSLAKHPLGNIQPLNVRDLYEFKETVITYANGYKDNVCNGLMDWDKIHLNDMGYRVLTQKGMLTISLNRYIPTYGPGCGTPKPVEKVSRRYKRTLAKRRKQEESASSSK